MPQQPHDFFNYLLYMQQRSTVIAILLLCIVLAMFLWTFLITSSDMREGMIATEPTPATGIIPYGYYRIDDTNMAKLPYGYKIDPTDATMKTIMPVTNTATYRAKPLAIPVSGIPDGYYQVSQGYMAVLPPGMKPKITNVNPDGTFVYDMGYVNENAFYELRFEINPTATKLPGGTYLTTTPGMIAVLPYGKIPNGFDKPGYVDNPNLISSTGQFGNLQNMKYTDLSGNYDIQFRQDDEELLKKDYMFSDSVGSITVLNASGEYVVIPRASVQGDLTYNEPGAFKYGGQSYVPDYEDAIYLSRVAKSNLKPDFYTPTDMQRGFCEFNRDMPEKVEEHCNNLDKNACGSTSCCVLLGGAKCVSGNARGPTNRVHYSDVFIRDKDYYYYQGKCYGNC